MPTKPSENPEYYEYAPVASEDVQDLMKDEIANAPRAPQELKQRLNEHNSSSPADAGGDIDASWEDVNDSGSESVGGHNPTPDQSVVEENAHAIGIDFQDNEPLSVWDKIEKRDRDRYELDENSKEGETI